MDSDPAIDHQVEAFYAGMRASHQFFQATIQAAAEERMRHIMEPPQPPARRKSMRELGQAASQLGHWLRYNLLSHVSQRKRSGTEQEARPSSTPASSIVIEHKARNPSPPPTEVHLSNFTDREAGSDE